jgi:HlyD family secretion protein
VIALIVGLLALGAYFLAPQILGPSISAMAITRQDITQTVVASGQVQSPHRVEISSQITGVVAEIPVAEGQTVKRGDVIIQLDRAEAESAAALAEGALAQAQARLAQMRNVQRPQAVEALEQARANFRSAQANLERAQQLRTSGFTTQVTLDAARRDRDVAQAQVRSAEVLVASYSPGGRDYVLTETQVSQAEASLKTAQSRLGYTTIAAPAEGTLIARNVERGWVVQPGRTLMTLSPTGETQLVVQIDEKNLGLLSLGQDVVASADAYPRQTFAARVVYINPGIDAQRGSVQVKMTVPKPPDYLRQDMTVSVDIIVAQHTHAIVVPTEAIHDLNGAEPWVMRIIDGRAARQPVQIGVRGTNRIEITSGLSPGDLVIPATATVTAGQRVRTRVAQSRAIPSAWGAR